MSAQDENIPYGKVNDAAALGVLVRAHRRRQGVTQRVVAGLSGVGLRFVSEVERGKASVELGRVMHVLGRMGLELWVVPRGTLPPGTPRPGTAPADAP